ncbi:MAG: hypothetical protein ABFS28_16355 [Bacteroidota bacterium]
MKHITIQILKLYFIFLLLTVGKVNGTAQNNVADLQISSFDIDATPPVGSLLAYDTMVNRWDLGLRARGLVIQGAGEPIVLCAIDWIGIANESQDVFKETLANAAHTVPERVVVHTLHQHDAPICDFSAEKMLISAGHNPGAFEGSYARKLLVKLNKAVVNSLDESQPVSHISFGKAQVKKVASNRRIMDDDGKVGIMRWSSCRIPELQAEPEGLIDPMVSVIGFWNDDMPVAVLSFYATHPQSYYLTKIANPDFPGVARLMRQLEVPDALHVHFTGAGGNIAAGKYNDGSKEMRGILADRLANGMKRAWKSSKKVPVSPEQVNWETEAVLLPPAMEKLDEIALKMEEEGYRYQNNMGRLAWYKRRQEGKSIQLSCLSAGEARVLFMPGELFVEYQLAAKAMRPDLFVSMAAYGDYGPSYIGTEEAYDQGGYEINVSIVTAESENILMDALHSLLHHK